MGADKVPVLPRPAQRRGQQLYAGNPRQHRYFRPLCPQLGHQRRSTGIKAGIPAVNQRGGLAELRLQAGQHFFRQVNWLAVGGTAIRQVLQQPLCPQNQPCRLQGLQALGSQTAGQPAAHANQCNLHNSSLHRCKISSAVSPHSSGRRSTTSTAPLWAAAWAFSAKPPALPPSLVTR